MIEPSDKQELEPRFARGIRTSLWGIEEMLYVIAGLLLLTAAVLVVVGTVKGLIDAISARQNAVDIGVVVLSAQRSGPWRFLPRIRAASPARRPHAARRPRTAA